MERWMRDLIRPTWIELHRLEEPREFAAYAERIFGSRKVGDKTVPYGPDEFSKRLGIDIFRFKGFYAEMGGTNATEGNTLPATKRLPIRPILAIRLSNSGKYYAEGLRCHTGHYEASKKRAWIPIEDYEKLFGDTLYEEIMNNVEKIEQSEANNSPQGNSNLKLVSAPAGATEKEKALVKKLMQEQNRGSQD